jgi:hypothetical protein
MKNTGRKMNMKRHFIPKNLGKRKQSEKEKGAKLPQEMWYWYTLKKKIEN